jgi:hypothetical protein
MRQQSGRNDSLVAQLRAEPVRIRAVSVVRRRFGGSILL